MMRTKGRGTIQAVPIGTADQHGVVEYMVDESGADLRLKRKLGLWHIVTLDGRELLVPVGLAVVAWEDAVAPMVLSPPPPGDRDLLSVVRRGGAMRKAPPTPLQPAPVVPIYSCPDCKSTYTALADVAVCVRRDKAGDGPVFRGGDCELCGYPAELHAGVMLRQMGPSTAEVQAYQALVDEVERTGGRGAAGSQDAQKALAAARPPGATWKAEIPAAPGPKLPRTCQLRLTAKDGVPAESLPESGGLIAIIPWRETLKQEEARAKAKLAGEAQS